MPMSDDQYSNSDTGLEVQEAKPKLKRPRLYKVVLVNDDYTPMDFVVLILEKFFQMDFRKSNTSYVAGAYPRKGDMWRFYQGNCGDQSSDG